MLPDSWPPSAQERAAARMVDAAFVILLRAWLLRKRAEQLLADIEEAPKTSVRSREK